MRALVQGATLAVALGTGLVAGVFFAFSSFVMAGLARLPAAQGMAAMQSINRTAVRPLFMAAGFGTALVCLGLAAWAMVNWGEPGFGWVLAGSASYILGALVVTIAANVPMNEAMAQLDPADPNAASFWTRYLSSWTAWNHVRTLASLGAAGLFTVALMQA
ncbi:MAG: DUF1772 domain-containing protein [Geodermatophilaceae bacterium]|jgi:uncharacterized membrane protein